MPKEAYRAALQPSHVVELAIGGHWLALSLAIFGLVVILAIVAFPARFSKAIPLAPLAWTMPLYLWALVASLGAMSTFDGLAVSHGITTLELWAAALSHGIALFAVLVLVTASVILASRPSGTITSSSVGPVAAVGAVSADWLFLLLLGTPMVQVVPGWMRIV